MEPYEVLLAEDDKSLRLVIAEVLKEAGLKVAEAADGVEALALLRKHPQPMTLLITDIRMPEMDGYELAEAAITLNPDIKMLMLTGYPEMRIPPPALQAREIRTLMKPVELDRLCTVALDMLSRP
jgi:two-component system cell cycle response regulator CpdR